MALRRGFKTEANWYARSLRQELALDAHAPLCQWRLAQHLGYEVVTLSSFGAAVPQSVQYLLSAPGQKDFSAVTVLRDQRRWIIHNDAHGRLRQSANIAHELAHGLLMHDPAPLTGADGARSFNKDQEDEANWLGPALLISEEAAVFLARRGSPAEASCDEYVVSPELLKMRLQVTGAHLRASGGRRRKLQPA